MNCLNCPTCSSYSTSHLSRKTSLGSYIMKYVRGGGESVLWAAAVALTYEESSPKRGWEIVRSPL